MTNSDDQLLSPPEVAAALGISVEGVRRRIAAGQIQAIKLGGHNSAVRVRRSELSHYIATHQLVHSGGI